MAEIQMLLEGKDGTEGIPVQSRVVASQFLKG